MIMGASKAPKKHCIAFNKYDGSNLRWEYRKKTGWCKQGTRTQLFDETSEVFGEAIKLFEETYADDIEKIIKDTPRMRNADYVTVFTEFYGPGSFAGQHVQDEPKELMLFDVQVHKRGIMDPKEFLKTFNHLKIPEVIYEGNMNQSFIDKVRDNHFVLNEGVVCKGGKKHTLWMCKIKTEAYTEALKELYEADWEKLWE